MEQGYLELITGTMFSGKSAKLIRKMKWCSHFGNVVFIQPKIDNRNYYSKDNHANSYLSKALFPRGKIVHWVVDELPTVQELEEWFPLSITNSPKYIFIDEGQFFENLWQADEYANHGFNVYVSALLFTSEKKWFQPLIEFYPCVNKITWCSDGYCSFCGKKKKNLSTVYLGGKKTTEVEVGSDEKYGLSCRECSRLRQRD